jgi:riboflavin kinase/FMN adenylyltransferase
MELFESFAKIKYPVAATIGVFDGVHLGHQALLQSLKKHGESLVITFKNHPKAFIQKTPIRYIHPFRQRVELLKHAGIDYLLALEFSEDIQSLTALQFLQTCQKYFSIHSLILGHDSRLGSDRVCDPHMLRKAIPTTLTVPPLQLDSVTISSQKIREAISAGDLVLASKWLGRPYELILSVTLETRHLALPPAGLWNVLINDQPGIVEVRADRSLKIVNHYSMSPFIKITWIHSD